MKFDVLFQAQTEFLNIIYTSSNFKSLRTQFLAISSI
jgi:hypothetical protein